MPTFIVSNIKEDDKEAVIVFLPPEAASLNEEAKAKLRDSLEKGAEVEGHRGDVIAVWEHEGAMSYMAPDEWTDFLTATTVKELAKKMNGKITCE